MPKNKDFQTIYNLIQEGRSYTDIQKKHNVGSSTITKLKAMSPEQFNTWLLDQNKPKSQASPIVGDPMDKLVAGIKGQGVDEALRLSKEMVQGFSKDNQDKFSNMMESVMTFKMMSQLMGGMGNNGNGHENVRIAQLEKQLYKQEEAAKFREVIQKLENMQKPNNSSSTPDSLDIMKLFMDQNNQNQTRMLEIMKTNSNNGGGGDRFKELAEGIESVKKMTRALGPDKESKTEVLANMLGSTVETALKSEGVQKALAGYGDTMTASAMEKVARVSNEQKIKEIRAKREKNNPGKPIPAPIIDHADSVNQEKPTKEAGEVLPSSNPGQSSTNGGAESLSQAAPPIPPNPVPGGADEYSAMLHSTPENEETVQVSQSLIDISDQPSKGSRSKGQGDPIQQKVQEMKAEQASETAALDFAEKMQEMDDREAQKGVSDDLVMISDKKPPDFRGGKL